MTLGRSLSIGLGMAVRGGRRLLKDPTRALSPMSTPLLSFIAFTGALSALAKTRGFGYYDYTVFEFVFVLYSGAMMVGVFTAFDITQDFESGLGSRLMLAVPRRMAILTGYLILGVVRIALRFQSQAVGGLILIPVYMALFLGPVLTPRDQLAGWLQAVARVNPLTYAMESGRGFLAADPVSVVPAFAAAAGLVIVCSVWAVLGMRKAEQGLGESRRERRRRRSAERRDATRTAGPRARSAARRGGRAESPRRSRLGPPRSRR